MEKAWHEQYVQLEIKKSSDWLKMVLIKAVSFPVVILP